MQLQKGIQLSSVAALPASVTGPEFHLPVEDSVGGKFSDQSIDLVSFDGIDPSDFEALSTPRPKALSDNQVKEANQLPLETIERNPLRRGGPNLRRSPAPNQQSIVEQLVAPIEPTEVVETPIELPPTPKEQAATASRSLANATSSRPLRENLRKNPLRR